MIEALKDDLKEDRKIIRVKTEIVKILKELPDDESRGRVIRAAAEFYGYRDLANRQDRTEETPMK